MSVTNDTDWFFISVGISHVVIRPLATFVIFHLANFAIWWNCCSAKRKIVYFTNSSKFVYLFTSLTRFVLADRLASVLLTNYSRVSFTSRSRPQRRRTIVFGVVWTSRSSSSIKCETWYDRSWIDWSRDRSSRKNSQLKKYTWQDANCIITRWISWVY